jgi:hypothetical protein
MYNASFSFAAAEIAANVLAAASAARAAAAAARSPPLQARSQPSRAPPPSVQPQRSPPQRLQLPLSLLESRRRGKPSRSLPPPLRARRRRARRSSAHSSRTLRLPACLRCPCRRSALISLEKPPPPLPQQRSQPPRKATAVFAAGEPRLAAQPAGPSGPPASPSGPAPTPWQSSFLQAAHCQCGGGGGLGGVVK